MEIVEFQDFFVDHDVDGDMDLVVGNGEGQLNQGGGTFVDLDAPVVRGLARRNGVVQGSCLRLEVGVSTSRGAEDTFGYVRHCADGCFRCKKGFPEFSVSRFCERMGMETPATRREFCKAR